MSFVGTLFVVLNQKYLPDGFFSATQKGISGTIYQDQNLTTPFNASAYPYIFIRIFHNMSVADLFNKQATWDSQTAGTFHYYIKKGDLPPPGIYRIKLELWDANPPVNEEVSTYPVQFRVITNPSL